MVRLDYITYFVGAPRKILFKVLKTPLLIAIIKKH